jgi:hypothetical protein
MAYTLGRMKNMEMHMPDQKDNQPMGRMHTFWAIGSLLAAEILYSMGSLLAILTSNSKLGILPSFVFLQILIFWIASRLRIRSTPFVVLWLTGSIFFSILHFPWLLR